MITFFRRFRQRLLTENKFSKYIFYATGEIILVVIGILIALQINNWNEHRKEINTANTIKKTLYNELVKDKILLIEKIKTLDSQLTHNSNLISRFEQANANLDTLKAIAQQFDPIILLMRNYNTTTYTSIAATGKIDFLEDDLKTALMLNNIEQNNSLQNVTSGMFLELTLAFHEKYRWDKPNNSYYSKLTWDIQNEREFVMLFTGLCNNKDYLIKRYLNYYKATLKTTLRVLNLLEDYDKIL